VATNAFHGKTPSNPTTLSAFLARLRRPPQAGRRACFVSFRSGPNVLYGLCLARHSPAPHISLSRSGSNALYGLRLASHPPACICSIV
jgi:hypothetical protein